MCCVYKILVAFAQRCVYNKSVGLYTRVCILGMLIDIRKSGYRISGPISGYENSQTISENNKWMVSRRWLRHRCWREMSWYSDTWYASLAAGSSSRCMWRRMSSHWGGGGWVTASCKCYCLPLSDWECCCCWHRPPAGHYAQTTHWANTAAHIC